MHSSPKSVQTPATPIKEVIKTVATSLKQNYELLVESHQGMKAKSEMVIGNKDETRKDKAMIPDNLIDNELASNSLSLTTNLQPKDLILLLKFQIIAWKIKKIKKTFQMYIFSGKKNLRWLQGLKQ